ncbi:tunicamycin resistance protein [Marasmius tenuissimus]|uniref:UDP-N-acetylglucosamine--dolichyl-phosphate N-acetylglucosaminephosphotransferase n=1 Tax=Marasmius tenuissimus TaxID=585030 RepID=A0ABR2Z7A6_9AGAR
MTKPPASPRTHTHAALAPRPLPPLLLLSLLPIASWFVLRPFLDPFPPLPGLYTSFGFSLFAFASVVYLVPKAGPSFVKAGLWGRDLLKVYGDPVPESQGLICASVYILTLILFIPFAFSDAFSSHFNSKSKSEPEGLSVNEFPLYQLSVYLSSILSIIIAAILGFLDDVFDIRWRHKLPIPVVASIPLLMVYFAEGGNTNVVVPIPFRGLLGLGALVNLVEGPLYYIYMSLLSTFTTNSINILAGINGCEVSQALIIALSVILNDLLYLPWPVDFSIPVHLLGSQREVEIGGVWSAGMAYGSREMVERHLFSLYFMMPLVGVCAGFGYHNWYPARAFPGDTLCYFAGMAFAVVGIQAHYSKTLLLFFMPQIFNFVLSCPQLFGLVPCPRHRVPRFSPETNLLYPSRAKLESKDGKPRPPSGLAALILRTFSVLGFVELTFGHDGEITETTNLTILNVLLVRFGPMREDRLVKVVVAVQIVGSVIAFLVRYGLASLVYDGDRR